MRTKNISNHSSTKNTNTMVGESASKKLYPQKKNVNLRQIIRTQQKINKLRLTHKIES